MLQTIAQPVNVTWKIFHHEQQHAAASVAFAMLLSQTEYNRIA